MGWSHFAARWSGLEIPDRFDYWLNTFRYMRSMAEFGCAAGKLDAIMARIQKEKDAQKRATIARDEALPVRKSLATLWCRMIGYQLAAVETVGEIGTIANLEQQSRGGMGLVNRARRGDCFVARRTVAGRRPTVARVCRPSADLAADRRRPWAKRMPTRRTGSRQRLRACNPAASHWLHSLQSFGTANDISNSPSLALPSFASWKTHCDGRASFIARSVLSDKRPTAAFFQKVQKETLAPEYYVRATWDDGAISVWPAASPSLNQMVVIYEALGRELWSSNSHCPQESQGHTL